MYFSSRTISGPFLQGAPICFGLTGTGGMGNIYWTILFLWAAQFILTVRSQGGLHLLWFTVYWNLKSVTGWHHQISAQSPLKRRGRMRRWSDYIVLNPNVRGLICYVATFIFQWILPLKSAFSPSESSKSITLRDKRTHADARMLPFSAHNDSSATVCSWDRCFGSDEFIFGTGCLVVGPRLPPPPPPPLLIPRLDGTHAAAAASPAASKLRFPCRDGSICKPVSCYTGRPLNCAEDRQAMTAARLRRASNGENT